MSNINVRGIAALSMLQVVDNKKSLTGILAYQSPKVADEDRGLLQNLCFGSSRYFFGINALSKILLQKPLPEEARPVHALLWVGLYQLAYSSISEHAAINETVEACTQLKLEKYKGVLNAILRRFQRDKEGLLEGLSDSDVTLYNHPKWYLKLLKKSWPEQWQSICEQGNLQAPMCLRVNAHIVSRDEYLLTLNDNDISASNGKHALTSIYLDKPCDVFSLPKFSEGSCSVQDEAAQLAAQILDPQAGEVILDACSAPGGKTCHILEASQNQAKVTAIDADEMRLVRVHENLARLKLNANVKHGEAQNPDSWWDGTVFDRILLDVPCSATGVIRRHPDIKLLRQKADIDNLAELQQEILQKAWTMLKPGGTLLYATCSIFPKENSLNIEKFLSLEKTALLQTLNLSTGIDTGFGSQLFPDVNSHDGFFYALLKKSQ
jgi:16S rRNA (cytosine967-C5)-methyltransferase